MDGPGSLPPGDVRVRLDEPGARAIVGAAVLRALGDNVRDVTILCIGSDRATGDCLGPLVGSLLGAGELGAMLGRNSQTRRVDLVGSLDSPIHAGNLEQCLAALSFSRKGHRIVAVDAALGRSEHVGTVLVAARPLVPGAGVKRALPPVGHLHVTGTVNVSGFMEMAVLQNTRLAQVMALAHVIADGLHLAVSSVTGTLVSEGTSQGSSRRDGPRSALAAAPGRLLPAAMCPNA